MNGQPLISVVLPSYNHGRHVDACLRAFLAQTVQDFELIIIDDASTDDNVAKIKQHTDPRIRLVQRPRNRGVAAGMNDGFLMARADIICFFATDDLPDAGYLAAVLKAFEQHPGAIAAYFPFRKIDEQGERLGEVSRLPRTVSQREVLRQSFLGGNQLPSPGMALRRGLVPVLLLPEGISQYSDWMLNNRLLLRGEIVLGAEPVLSYRVSSASLSSRSDKAIAREALELRMMMDDFLQVATMAQVCEIFGEDAREFAGMADVHVPYVLGRLALRSHHHEKRCWGYETIMRHVSAPGMAAALADAAGFTYGDLMALVPLSAGSPVKEITDLRRRLRRMERIALALLLGLGVLAWLLLRR